MGRPKSSSREIMLLLIDHGVMEPLFASQIYKEERLIERLTEQNYFQILSRLCKNGKLRKLAKGIYYIPNYDVSFRQITDNEIVEMFTNYHNGIEVGEKMFYDNKIMLNRYSKRMVYTSLIKDRKMIMNGIVFKRICLSYSKIERTTIEILEVLDNYYRMSDVDHRSIIDFYLRFIKNYDDNVARRVIDTIGYSKSTIDFLKAILDKYRIPNTLSDYLSKRSKYRHPTVDELKYMADWDRRNLKRRKIPNQTKGI